VKATTHTEIYRPFAGELGKHPLRFWPIAWGGIKVARKRKLPMLLLFSVPTIWCIVACVLVNAKYSVATVVEPGQLDLREQFLLAAADNLVSVANEIARHTIQTRFIALLCIAWYGAGLIADDKRLGANLLYFSRPITRLDYILGKFSTAAFFGSLAVLVPTLVICMVAAFASPEWSFVKEQGDVILKAIGYSVLWITTVTLLVLAVSSLVDRKTFGLVGVFGVVMITEACSGILFEITDEVRWRHLSLFGNFRNIAETLFDVPRQWYRGMEVSTSYLAIGCLITLCSLILAWRLRRMEVVA